MMLRRSTVPMAFMRSLGLAVIVAFSAVGATVVGQQPSRSPHLARSQRGTHASGGASNEIRPHPASAATITSSRTRPAYHQLLRARPERL